MRDFVKTVISFMIFGALVNYWLIPYSDSFVNWVSARAVDIPKNEKILELTAVLSILAYIVISDMVEGFLGFFRKKVPVAVKA